MIGTYMPATGELVMASAPHRFELLIRAKNRPSGDPKKRLMEESESSREGAVSSSRASSIDGGYGSYMTNGDGGTGSDASTRGGENDDDVGNSLDASADSIMGQHLMQMQPKGGFDHDPKGGRAHHLEGRHHPCDEC